LAFDLTYKKAKLEEFQMKPCNESLSNLLAEAEKLMRLADEGDMNREDDGCGVLYGMARDYANKLSSLAKQEIKKHKLSGRWE